MGRDLTSQGLLTLKWKRTLLYASTRHPTIQTDVVLNFAGFFSLSDFMDVSNNAVIGAAVRGRQSPMGDGATATIYADVKIIQLYQL